MQDAFCGHHDSLEEMLIDLGVEAIQGYPSRELESRASDLRLVLPKSLQQFYERFAATPSVCQSFERFLPPGEWRLVEGRLIFAEENQGVVSWGLGIQDLSRESDPIVHAATNDEPPNWFKEDLPISLFAPFLFLANVGASFELENQVYADLSVTQLNSLQSASRFDAYSNGLRVLVVERVVVSVLHMEGGSHSATFSSKGRDEAGNLLNRLT